MKERAMTGKSPEHFRVDRMATPIGEALIVTDQNGILRAFDWADHEMDMRRLLCLHYGSLVPEPGAAPGDLKGLLRRYFEGDLGGLGAIEWRTAGTPFQRAVWAALTAIAPGQTMTYRTLAVKLGRPKAMRAVGTANGSNPISVVIPCHRVIGADGSLTGYGGGIERKKWLLNHEGADFRDKQGSRADTPARSS
jgi:methylated-DNA-[protein]-cysteine S-methyltransferase